MKNNLTKWKSYVETEEDKQVYERSVKVISINISKGNTDDKKIPVTAS